MEAFCDGMVPEFVPRPPARAPTVITSGTLQAVRTDQDPAPQCLVQSTDNVVPVFNRRSIPSITTGATASVFRFQETEEAAPCGNHIVPNGQPAKMGANDHSSVHEVSRTREQILAKYREKKARRNLNRPRVQYESRKRTALVKPRINGKFVTPEVFQQYMTEQGATHHTVPTS